MEYYIHIYTFNICVYMYNGMLYIHKYILAHI